MMLEHMVTLPNGPTGLSPVRAANLPERIADQLIEAVGRRQLVPGQRLIETELSGQLSVSRVPLREALRILECQGIVTAQPRRGVRLIAFDETWARHLYDVRVALERLGSHAAARRLRNEPAARDSLDTAIDEIERVASGGDMFALNQADLALHSTIYQLSGSPLLQTLWSAIARHVLIIFSRETYRFHEPERIVSEHHDLRRALLHGNAAAIDAEVARHVAGNSGLLGRSTQRRRMARMKQGKDT